MNKIIIIFATTLLFACNTKQKENNMIEQTNKIIIAHRGASGYLPEHTLQSKAMAYAMNADYLEQDLALSKDDVPIVIHDIHLETVTDVAEKYPEKAREDGKFYVIDFTFNELKTLSVFERFNPQTGKAVFPNRFSLKKSSFKLHSLQDEIEMIQGLNKSTGKNIGIYPEIKEPAFHRKEGKDISKIVIDILNNYGYKTKNDKCFLQCFDFEETKRIRFELKSNLKLIQLLEDDYTENDFEKISEYADGLGPWFGTIITGKNTKGELIITDFVEKAHNQQLLVHPYTFRADAFPEYFTDFDELLEAGLFKADFDGIFTDFTDKAVKFLEKKHLRMQVK
ncbi:MAG: glycerophosphodiester phosphodiesterase [Bacteroidales bacterium]|nr:glycerophosphodiester phosphodiesterase [Bacteroidales bacterium]MBN2755874.1 glycerophosphodiester phosphodiesterase [Bacteroidales bacterium]